MLQMFWLELYLKNHFIAYQNCFIFKFCPFPLHFKKWKKKKKFYNTTISNQCNMWLKDIFSSNFQCIFYWANVIPGRKFQWNNLNIFMSTLSVPPLTPYITPQCNLPRNVSGEWYTQGIQFMSRVVVNDTHIHYFTTKNEFEFEETYLSCQQTLGTRYLMTKYIVGKWLVLSETLF